MAACNACNRFCPPDEGQRYCQVCMPEYIRCLEEIEKAARAAVAVLDGSPGVLPDKIIKLSNRLENMELMHGLPAQSQSG